MNAKEAFERYMKNYDLNDFDINLKYEHTFRVATRAKELAETLNLSSEDIELAYLCGFLHDIGRFEQIKVHHTYIDTENMDHGDYGVLVLFEKGLIKHFTDKKENYSVIEKCVYNHNKHAIESNLSEKELLFCQIVRDADKLDIFDLIINDAFPYECNGKVTKEIHDDIIIGKCVKYPNMKTATDNFVAWLSYIYDINFDWSFEYLNKNKIVNKLEEKTKDTTTELYVKQIKKYIKERLEC